MEHEDYALLLKERNMTEDQAQAIVTNPIDLIPLPLGQYKFTFSDSPIHGKGVFAVANIAKGEVIGPARIEGNRTPIGRYTNHSPNPNAFPMLVENGTIVLVANTNIHGSSGGVKGDEITVNYRDSSECAKLLDKEMKLCLHL